jgi:hypothetical protein
VVEANWSWRIAMLPSRDLVVSTDGKGFLRKLVPPAVVIQEACGKPVQGAPLRQPPMPESQHPHSSFMERRQMLV